MKQDFALIYEDDYLFAVNKPAKVASVPSEGIEERHTMQGMIQKQFEDKGADFKPYLLHRIDMQTSGLLLFGKHERDREQLEAILRQKDAQKKYVTLLKGIPHGSVITAKLQARTTNLKVFAQTLYKVIRVYKLPALRGVVSLVEAQIRTGRKHQIRQHFAGIKCPVVMDEVYGDFHFNRVFRTTYRLGRQFLHSKSLTFMHPFLNKTMTIEAPLPKDLEIVLDKMSGKIPVKSIVHATPKKIRRGRR